MKNTLIQVRVTEKELKMAHKLAEAMHCDSLAAMIRMVLRRLAEEKGVAA